MNIHSALGKRLGISKEEIEALIALDRSCFDFKEWLALKFVQDCTFLNGEIPTGEYISDFERIYSAGERGYIIKLFRTMQFANYWNNRFRKNPWRSSLEGQKACSLEKISKE